MNRFFVKVPFPARNGFRFLLSCVFFTCFVFLLCFHMSTFDLFTDSTMATMMEVKGRSEVGLEKAEADAYAIFTPGCRIPDMDPFDPAVVNVTSDPPDPFQCTSAPWVGLTYIRGDLLRVNLEVMYQIHYNMRNATIAAARFYCCVWFIYSNNEEDADDFMRFPSECVRFSRSVAIGSEYMKVDCLLDGKRVYETYHHHYGRKPEVEARCSSATAGGTGARKPSVLLLFVDSVSRVNFKRNMAASRQTLLEELDAVEMHGYNRVGDNTFPNMVALLAGATVDQLRSRCWGPDEAHLPFDACNKHFLWSRYADAGYRTAFVEEVPAIGAFHFEKAGFRSAPVDYYPHNYFSQIHPLSYEQHDCINGISETELVMLMALQLAQLFPRDPFFGLFVATRFTHTTLDDAQLMDEVLQRYLKKLIDDRLLEDTFLFVFGDHGLRFGAFRDTEAGGYEVNLPAFYVVVPRRFRSENATAFENLVRNSRRLTTPFDFHWTLQGLLDSQDGGRPADNYGAISMFEPIPETRTCREARIPPEFCGCRESEGTELATPAAADVVERLFLRRLNELTAKNRRLCAELRLGRVVRAKEIRRPDGERNTSGTFLEIVFEAQPGGGIFQGTVEVDRKPDEPLDDIVITRINAYGNSSACITNDSLLRQYCFCV